MNTMKTSPAGLKFLEDNEGRRLTVYRDVAGLATVGVGHLVLLTDFLQVGDRISQALCDDFLEKDVSRCEQAINIGVTVPITSNQFDALVSLCFNIGVVGFLASTVLRDLNAGLIADEKRAFELWDKDVQAGVKVVDAALLARRDREVALFMTPDADS